MYRKQLIIVAGGAGLRFGAATPKQFLRLRGICLLELSLRTFKETFGDIQLIAVIPQDQKDLWLECVKEDIRNSVTTVAGGITRLQSVKNGLAAVTREGVIGIHDAVRPLVSPETIRNAYDTAFQLGNAIPVIPVSDSLRMLQNDRTEAVDRNRFVAVQTPQCFKADDIYFNAYENAEGISYTDDASVWEKAGIAVNICAGNTTNIKITHPADLLFAEALTAHEE